MPAETAAEKKAREQREAAAEQEELELRSLYEEYGLDYDDESHRNSVNARRLARRLEERDAERKEKPPKGGGGPTSIF